MAEAATIRDHARHYAAGFNAFGQLFGDTLEDISNFRELDKQFTRGGGIVFAGWSTTLVAARPVGAAHSILRSAGHAKFEIQLEGTFQHAFGDHNGCAGGLDDEGNLILLGVHGLDPPLLSSAGSGARHRLSHIAKAGNGRIAMILRSATAHECNVVELDTWSDCVNWLALSDAAERANSVSKHVVPGTPTQLVAGAATFVLLMEGGAVYTWGDPRYQSLGRTIAGKDAVPATRPGLVSALDGLVISKVAVGGWISAALSNDNALYLWGTNMPGSHGVLDVLKQPKDEDVTLVEIVKDGSDALDVLDVSVGDDHVAVIAEGGHLFVAGANGNGQLGLGSVDSFVAPWTKVARLPKLQGVRCGPRATFVWE